MMMTAQSQESVEREPPVTRAHSHSSPETPPEHFSYPPAVHSATGRLAGCDQLALFLLCVTLGKYLFAMASFSENAIHQRIIEIKFGTQTHKAFRTVPATVTFSIMLAFIMPCETLMWES